MDVFVTAECKPTTPCSPWARLPTVWTSRHRLTLDSQARIKR